MTTDFLRVITVAVALGGVIGKAWADAETSAAPPTVAVPAAPPSGDALDELPGVPLLSEEPFFGDLPAMRERGFVRVLITHNMTDFFVAGGKLRGIQAELLHEYEKILNQGIKREHEKVKLLFIPVTADELVPALLRGEADVAASFLTITQELEADVDVVTGGVRQVDEVLVTHAKDGGPTSLEDLSGMDIYVPRDSSYALHLQQLNQAFGLMGLEPARIVEADSHLRTEDILEMVNAGVVGATIVHDFQAELWAKVLPDIRVHPELAISRGKGIGWAIRHDSPELKASIMQLAQRAKKGTLLGNILFDRYFANTRWISNPLADEQQKRFERYLSLFKKYGALYDLDHLALIAQAFKESGLDNSRKSQRGAVGLMQVLPSTAKDHNVDIPDIHDPENNVHAAAKYMAFLRDRYFSDRCLDEVDRLAFTWAAYNAGPAKVRRMRALAKEMGRDPNRWFGHVEHAAGRMVGRETVKYVGDVYKYYVAYRLIHQLEIEAVREQERPDPTA